MVVVRMEPNVSRQDKQYVDIENHDVHFLLMLPPQLCYHITPKSYKNKNAWSSAPVLPACVYTRFILLIP